MLQGRLIGEPKDNLASNLLLYRRVRRADADADDIIRKGKKQKTADL